ncbi:hypothetical protein EXU85_18055 [Spirosoma sp. KCTC 42546]|uniref:hypothetical protein n=1 Tax=Spirosoma sp. KCTC 42546 TaxID=2520506 RepID=UPI00115B93AC|nr:hypothetical protein [Spirosoma sp. KCTC 42546]QDK80404.1 hypothetical protein EXU85_18055 [Spirosoma sp. KCTC 42546]
MKNPLILFLLGLLSLLVQPIFGQKIIEKTLPVTADQTVNLNLKFADSIKVRYWDKPTVTVRIEVTINGGRLNDALLVTTGSTSQEVSIKTDFDKEMIKQGKAEDCPDQRHSWSSDQDGKRYYVCSTLNYEVFVPRQAQLKLETINGNIDIQGATGPVFAKTISGFVDMSWPKSKGANVAMKTITGEVYSDMDISFKNKKEKNPIVGYQLEGSVNGGGPKVQLESISNNIYLRRKD